MDHRHRDKTATSGLTLDRLLRQSARRFAELPFLIEEDRRTTFAEFDREVDILAAGLARLGVVAGEHVAIWLPNGRDWILAFCAVARLGAVTVPVNTRYKAEEARYVIEHSDARVIFMTRRMWGIDFYEMLVSLAPELPGQTAGTLALQRLPLLRAVVMVQDSPAPGTITMTDLCDVGAAFVTEDGIRPSDLLLICYTSGTTGRPKGVMHHHGVIEQSTKVGLAMHVDPGDRIMAHMPFYHSAGLFMALIPALSLGAALVPLAHWDPERALDLIARHRITMFGGVPTHFHDLVAVPWAGRADTSSLKAAWIGGSAVMHQTFGKIMRVLRLPRLLSTYGMTENTISTSFNAWDDPVDVCSRNTAPLLGSSEVRIVDPETLAERPSGRDGEIWCRGATVMIGYYRDPEGTRQAVTTDGWLRTGDIGHLDEGGYLAITGRIKEMLKIGGNNTSPIDIEQHLAGHPSIRASVVVGVPDPRLGQVAYAYVETEPESGLTAADVIAFCREHLADYKVPRHVRFVTSFPRTATGKIRRGLLAEAAEEDVAGSGPTCVS